MGPVNLPTVASVTPTVPPRLGGPLIRRALNSIADQKRPANEEIIQVDWERAGPAATRNAAIDRVDSDWVAFLDDDDWWYPHHLRNCLYRARVTDADLVYPNYEWVEDGRVTPDPLRRMGKPFDAGRLRAGNFIPITVVVRTALLRKVGGFPTGENAPLMGRQRCEDWGLWLRLLDAGARFEPLHQVTWRYHRHPNNFSGQLW